MRTSRKQVNTSLSLHDYGKRLILNMDDKMEYALGNNGTVKFNPTNKKWELLVFKTDDIDNPLMEKIMNADKFIGKGFSELHDILIRLPYKWENKEQFETSKSQALKSRYSALVNS